MSWVAQDAGRANIHVDADKERTYNEARAEALPVLQQEAEGMRPFAQLKFQPVKSPGQYEAEFAVKGKDLIFHFWPWGYHEAEKAGVRPPAFRRDFQSLLASALSEAFDLNRIEASDDRDMGAVSVKAFGYGESLSYRELSIKACEKLHYLLGGN